MSIILILLVIALILFVLATINIQSPVNLTALGLAFVVLAFIASKAVG